MNNENSLMDTTVPHISGEMLSPTRARREIPTLADTVKESAKNAWKNFCNWLMNYVPEPVRADPASAIEKLKGYVKDLYKKTPDFKATEKSKGVKGYFKTFTIEGRDDFDPPSYLRAAQPSVVGLIENNLNQGVKVKLVLQCDIKRKNPAIGDVIATFRPGCKQQEHA